MSDRHEQWLLETFGGTLSAGSGNQNANPMDTRQNRHEQEFSFAFDGKATLGNSNSIPLEMWEKVQYQAHKDRPALALRYYLNERLSESLDLIVIGAEDFQELLERANETS
jgi:hypothetical protein